MSWLKELIGPAIEAFNGWRTRKHEIKMKKHELEVTKVESETKIAQARAEAESRAMLERAAADINWELASIQNSGWRDEYITILFTLPAIGIFVPFAQEYVFSGFQYLADTPFWYQVILMGIVGSALGIRIWDAFVKPLRMTKEPGKEK